MIELSKCNPILLSRELVQLEKPNVVVTFSGGKDSVATWLYLSKEMGLDVQCVFADTGHESDLTYQYIDDLERWHGLPIVRLTPLLKHIWKGDPPPRVPREMWDTPIDMRRMIKEKGRPPSATARFCTTILKLRPLSDYVHMLTGNVLMACGVRAEESEKRASQAVMQWDDMMDRWRWLPIHSWSAKQVFEIHKKYSVPPNPLYLKGCSRVGCWPCIFARKSELAIMAKDPVAVERLKLIESETNQTFFAEGKVSKAYRSDIHQPTGKRINWAEDVFRWALGEQPAFALDGLFADEDLPLDVGDDIHAESCSSVYGLCE